LKPLAPLPMPPSSPCITKGGGTFQNRASTSKRLLGLPGWNAASNGWNRLCEGCSQLGERDRAEMC
jgi:hypothetical protein